MSEMSIEMLTPERVVELEDVLRPLFKQACDGNDVAQVSLTEEDILVTAKAGLAAVFVGSIDGRLECTVVVQFGDEGVDRVADVLAMAGRHLTKFRNAYWNIIVEWLRANGVKYLDAYTSHRLEPIFLKKFGFDMSCAYVRKVL